MLDDFKIQGSVKLDGSGFSNDLKKLDTEATSFTSGLNKSLLTSVASFASVSSAVALLSATLKSAVADYAQLDKGMAKVNTLIQLNEGQTAAFRLELLGVSEATGVWAGDLAEASYQASSAGVATEELTGFVSNMAMLSKAGFTDVSSAVSVVTSTMNSYGKEVYSVQEISDKLLRTQNNGVTTVKELGAALYNVVPSASALGVGLDEVLGGIATLTKSGVPTAQATTMMRNVINELGDDSKGVGLIFKELTGKTFVDFIKSGGSMASVMATLGDYADSTEVPVSRLFSSVESGTGALVLGKDGAAEFQEQIVSLGNAAGDTAKAYEIATNNIADNWDKAKNSMRTTSVEVVADNEKMVSKMAAGIGWLGEVTMATIGYMIAAF
ncbi:MAG: phage tail tape measure protein, partial [Fusobacteriaceae bacterium]